MFNPSSLLSLVASAALVTALPVDETSSLVARSPDAQGGVVTQAIRGFDISSPQPLSWFQCAKRAGYGKAVFRAYQQACGSVGSF